MARYVLILMLLVLVTGAACADEADEGTQAAKPAQAVEIVIQPSAATSAEAAGVDLDPLVRRTVADVFRLLPVTKRPIRIEVIADSNEVIPEVGIGGHANPGGVVIVVDRPLRPGTPLQLRATLAHELHHVVRFRVRSNRQWTLADALVVEGLADHFEQELLSPHTPRQPWIHVLSADEERRVWARAQHVIDVPGGYDYRSWFYGGENLVRWTGYTLGYRMVAAYLGDGKRASSEVDVDPAAVVEAYRAAVAARDAE